LHHGTLHVRHRKEDSDRGEADENCVFSNLHKHNNQEASRNDTVNNCHIRDLRSTTTENCNEERRDEECLSRLSENMSNEKFNSKLQDESIENNHSFHIYGKDLSTNSFSPNHSNLVSHSKFHNVSDIHISDKTNSNQCLKNALKSYQCSMSGVDISKLDSENEVKNINSNNSESSVKAYDRLFPTDKKTYHKFSDNVSYDVNCRKSPIHGKAPRSSPFHETKDFDKLNSLEGSAGEILESNVNLNYKQSEITSIEPSNTSKFHKVDLLDGSCKSRYPSDIKDCAKILDNQDNDLFFNSKPSRVIKEEIVKNLSESSDNVVQTKKYLNDFITQKSEDTRTLTLKRCDDMLSHSRKTHSRKQAKRSSRTKFKKMKNGRNLLDKCSVRLTRSQKKDPQQPSMPIGAADDDSGIQGDIYEFSEKESNLEDISLPNRVPHLRDKYNEVRENPPSLIIPLDPWRGCDKNQDTFNNDKERQSRENSVSSEEKHE
jgi:hypothetical protein